MRVKAIFSTAVLAGVGALILIFVPQTPAGKMQGVTIGIPDGSPGLIIQYLADKNASAHRIRTKPLVPYTLYDCCAAATQYAMGSGRLDMAVMCIKAAGKLVQKDSRYLISGPVIFNSDVLITRPEFLEKKLTIAVSQQRGFQQKIVMLQTEFYGKPVSMLHSAVPYAYSRGVVDGAVVDIIRAMDLKGKIHGPVTLPEKERVTHVLVVKKNFCNQPAFIEFMDSYNQIVDQLKTRQNLADLLRTYISKDVTQGDIDLWEKMNVHFTHPLNNHRQGSICQNQKSI